jgi:hypothetical protein
MMSKEKTITDMICLRGMAYLDIFTSLGKKLSSQPEDPLEIKIFKAQLIDFLNEELKRVPERYPIEIEK